VIAIQLAVELAVQLHPDEVETLIVPFPPLDV
jgi:hypothetical protein